MFERYITDALTTHFGHILETVDADKMQLSAWKGELELHDVTLKSDALDNILQQECPVEIAYGSVGTFHVKIPWSLLSSQLLSWQKETNGSEPTLLESSACSLVLTDVNILVTPRRKEVRPHQDETMTNHGDQNRDGETEGESQIRRRAEKEKEVQSLLDGNLLKRVTESSVSSSRWAWLQSWISSLLSTLSVTVRNIHIRYEDPGTSMGFHWTIDHRGSSSSSPSRRFTRHQRYRPAFAVGITLRQFSIQSVASSSAEKVVVVSVTATGDEIKEEDVSSLLAADELTTSFSTDQALGTHNKTETIAQSQVQTPASSFMKRYKLAAADQLAIYWDSDSPLVCESYHDSIHGGQKSKGSSFFQDSFALLNDGNDSQLPILDSGNIHDRLNRHKHSYLLNPISPSVNVTLVSKAVDLPNSLDQTVGETVKVQNGEETHSSKHLEKDPSSQVKNQCPPSSIQIDLPPCKFTLARSTLEDSVYLRKSLSVWMDATKTLLSESTLRRLANLRPVHTPLEDPTSWWLYAFEATKALTRVEQQLQVRDNNVLYSTSRKLDTAIDHAKYQFPLTRRKGWYGLVQAVSRRRKYVRLNETLMEASLSNDSASALSAHNALLDMEDELLPQEIVSFRIYLYEKLTKRDPLPIENESAIEGNDPDPKGEQEKILTKGETDDEILSVQHRLWMMNEVRSALDRERANKERQAVEEGGRELLLDRRGDHNCDRNNPTVWESSLVCREFAIQVNDQATESARSSKRRRITPIVRMASAIVQDQSWREDGSWNSNWMIASLEIKDLMSSKGRDFASPYFASLVRGKNRRAATRNEEFIIINGIRYCRHISVTVDKELHWPQDNQRGFKNKNSGRGSTTTTQIRVLPMEVVYSTLPVEAVSRVFASVRTPEIVDDYHKVLAAASSWREDQKRKLMDALAHRNKKIIVDIDIGAPEIFIPEDIYRYDSPMLALDLGRIQAYNDDDALKGGTAVAFDDQWRVIISNMQVRSTVVASYYLGKQGERNANVKQSQQLVEAFSIDFAVCTKISSESNESGEASKIHVSGTLPRLAFNISSSSIFLVSRLQERWKRRKREMEIQDLHYSNTHGFVQGTPSNHFVSRNNHFLGDETKSELVKQSARIFQFNFLAPSIFLKLEDDADRRSESTQIFDLAIGGISGSLTQHIATNGDSSTKFNASLQFLGMIDLYQSAGREYVLLLSSVPQVALIDDISVGDSYAWKAAYREFDDEEEAARRTALVTFEYSAEDVCVVEESKTQESHSSLRNVAIWFHELYIEWNPETLAAIQRAIRSPVGVVQDDVTAPQPIHMRGMTAHSSASDDEFFDAVQEWKEEEASLHSISEISSSSDIDELVEASSSPSRHLSDGIHGERLPTPTSRLSFSTHPGSPFASGLSNFDPVSMASVFVESKKELLPSSKPISVVFQLSKLRVSFNKETRHRKLLVAQMDGTSISFASQKNGGSRTKMQIGNLLFIDPSHEHKETLYGHILGLQNDATNISHLKPSSLLEMEIRLNPAQRSYSSMLEGDATGPVVIDRQNGAIIGCDCSLKATFSPMRFVLIEQLWLEVMDYFFQGLIGPDVLGSSNSKSVHKAVGLNSTLEDSIFLPGSDAEGISFTRFRVTVKSPVILVPVTYASPEFVRLELSTVELTNNFQGTVVFDRAYGTGSTPFKRMQWFNNCVVTLEDLRLFSWSGTEFGKTPVCGSVHLRWPSGPFAGHIIPKWRVKCHFDELEISLRRSDYSLLQNIISYNIGEQSRYMDEWTALQNLTPDVLQKYMQQIIVHYGYDKKDVAPSTYQMSISLPLAKCNLVVGQNISSSLPLAIARCFNLEFEMEKGSDLIVKQTVTCNVDLVTPKKISKVEYESLLSMSKFESGVNETESTPDARTNLGLAYVSVSLPNKNTVRTVEISEACIHMILPKWRELSDFFRALPPPILLNQNDIGSSIQVGDRWYRIGESDTSPISGRGSAASEKRNSRILNWINVGSLTNNYPVIVTRNSSKLSMAQQSNCPTAQIRILLTWPRIVLSSAAADGPPTRVVLRMHHLEYLQTNANPHCSLEKTLLLHDVEVYAASGYDEATSAAEEQQNSLIHPWSLALAIFSCNGESVGDCEMHQYKLSSERLRARAAYSDMAIATDVVLSVLHSAKEETKRLYEDLSLETVFTAGSYDSADSGIADLGESTDKCDSLACNKPSVVAYDLECDGFELQVSDDSGRHFASSQDLVTLTMGTILFSRREFDNDTISMRLWLKSLDLIDCLQPRNSQFRMAASGQLQVTGEKSVNQEEVRDSDGKMNWDGLCSTTKHPGMYETTTMFAKRVEDASKKCSLYLWKIINNNESPPGLVEVKCDVKTNSQEYDVRFRSFEVQWNPSTVIAVQRFLGRLRKETEAISIQFNEILENSEQRSNEEYTVTATQDEVTVSANIQIDRLKVCLNKEHQCRRLLELSLSDCSAKIMQSEIGTTVEASIRDLSAIDTDRYNDATSSQHEIQEENRNVISVLKQSNEGEVCDFFRVAYKKFGKATPREARKDVPKWVLEQANRPDEIDDFLSVTLAATRFTYLKERTEEILDYLSNGLPGRGMGATSRAAKGFISRRIQSKSFLQIQVHSPRIDIPQHAMETIGVAMKLGDVAVNSWFEERRTAQNAKDDIEWWRVLSFKLRGFFTGITRDGAKSNSLSSVTNPIDLDILLRKPTVKGRAMSVRGNLSRFAMALNYNDYAVFRATFRDNIGRSVNTEQWDNVEKAFWLETSEQDAQSNKSDSQHVHYSSNARFVRYGKGGKNSRSSQETSPNSMVEVVPDSSAQNTLDLRFDLDGLSIRLRRDDIIPGISLDEDISTALNYDVVLLRVQTVEVLMTANSEGDISLNLSLFRLGLFDLGDKGRLTREQYYVSLSDNELNRMGIKRKGIRHPCPFHVLVEGYDSSLKNEGETDDQNGPQFVVSIDTCPASSTTGFGSLLESGLPPDAKATVARLVINHLSVNALVRPYREMVEFLTCQWETNVSEPLSDVKSNKNHKKCHTVETDVSIASGRGFELKVVAHYPRIFFLADESDLHSRALVLRGLAVVNVTDVTKAEVVRTRTTNIVDAQHVTSVDAQLHGLETYINPDVYAALRFSPKHAEIIGDDYDMNISFAYESDSMNGSDMLGVALIQPVTSGIEFMQIERDLFPTRRSIVVNMEPVSTMLSFEDIELVEVVFARWSSREEKEMRRTRHQSVKPQSERKTTEQYEVVFNKDRLGLGLKMEGQKIVISNVHNESCESRIRPGDRLLAIAGEETGNQSLETVVSTLGRAKRPISMTFERSILSAQDDPVLLEPSAIGNSDMHTDVSSINAAFNQRAIESFPCALYSLQFQLGMPLGFELEESVSCKFPTVSRILPSIDDTLVMSNAVDESNAEQIEIVEPFDAKRTRVPRLGAVIVAIDDVPIEEIGVGEAWKLLEQTIGSEFALQNNHLANSASFSLTFQEISSSVWGSVDSADISIAGIELSFIDDLNGRDMPLFRSQLSALEINAKRGIGVDAHIIDIAIPMVLSPLDMEGLDDSVVTLTSDVVRDMQNESVVSLSAIGRFSVDYFNLRVAFWEPLLEPSQIYFLLEKQEGSIEGRRPTEVALEISDRLPHNHFVRANLSQSIYFQDSPMVHINITDAAAEVVCQAIGQWKKWRRGIRSREFVVDAGSFRESPWQTSMGSQSTFDSISADLTGPNTIQIAAAQKAAQAALNFAQKRGAETSKNRETSKPFIFRNRTGISVAFVQQGKGMRDHSYNRRRLLESRHRTETPGAEYRGLEGYEDTAITQIADREEARFDLDLLSAEDSFNTDANTKQSVRNLNTKVRSYEGRYPYVTVALQAVAGMTFEPLVDLQVFKVGSTVRYLTIKKETSGHGISLHAIRIIWNVEIEDNRRILTLSTGVRLVSSGLDITIDVGVGYEAVEDNDEITDPTIGQSVTQIGVAASNDPFYVPLWVALRFEPVAIFVKPASSATCQNEWSHRSFLRFTPVSSKSESTPDLHVTKWAWEETYEDLTFVSCKSTQVGRDSTVWLSVFGSSSDAPVGNTTEKQNEAIRIQRRQNRLEAELSGVLSIVFDSCVTLRNMLPFAVEWEISYNSEGCSSLKKSSAFVPTSPTNILGSGECCEVLECRHSSVNLQARFKQPSSLAWSTWASLKLQDSLDLDDDYETNDGADLVDRILHSPAQINVEIPDQDFGIPFVLGVRVAPKMTTEDPFRGHLYGLEVIAFVELWIRNITELPLNFGCPVYQLHNRADVLSPGSKPVDESVAKFTAESALMEIANLLEVGDKGTGLNQAVARKIAECGTIESLPNQVAPLIVQEVFEYVEIEGAHIRRSWWASESFDSYRKDIIPIQSGKDWKWIDDMWAIDSAGEAKPAVDGWESCRNLLAGDGSFAGKRSFNRSHGFRRRRYFRSRTGTKPSDSICGEFQAFHQPLNDSFSREQKIQRRKTSSIDGIGKDGVEDDSPVKLSIKCGDGKWSSPLVVPTNGSSYGVIKVPASRWPHLATERVPKLTGTLTVMRKEVPVGNSSRQIVFKPGCLDPTLYELCYAISDLPGEWGEFSRTFEVSPRFVLRNDSKSLCLEVKQTGAPDTSILRLKAGQAQPFYWANFQLPKLVSVKPVDVSGEVDSYNWSGGFDLCNLGMTPIRIRKRATTTTFVLSIRSLVEIRPGTGGMGINISLREENENGEGSLFRIENLTPFPIWLEQDGILANPSSRLRKQNRQKEDPPLDGDLIPPNSKLPFALDIPYRQGKYATRREATLAELLQVRVALAPLSSRAGVEMVKVVGLTAVGDSIRLNPSKLPLALSEDDRRAFRPLRVLGVVASDGPTRVLRFCLMSYSVSEDIVASTLGDVSQSKYNARNICEPIISADRHDLTPILMQGAKDAVELLRTETVPCELDAKRRALFSNFTVNTSIEDTDDKNVMDTVFSVRAEFSGFVLSLVDSAPSEIAVVSCRNVNVLTRWNGLRTADASVLMSIGWLQVDNHVPSAPFKVAVRPDTSLMQRNDQRDILGEEGVGGPSPLLVVAMAFAPKHKSKIMVLRSVTVAPRDLVIAIDLAFLVRMQRFLIGLQDHVRTTATEVSFGIRRGLSGTYEDDKRRIRLPDFESTAKVMERISSFSENQKLYFQGLSILPTNIKLSVAPARALTPEQASLEGKETAAIHEAVRKGDILVGSSAGPLGVRVGKKNKTPLAVVRGVFKSIFVDAILRLDGASLSFPGVFLRNHIATGSQLSTFLLAHYVSSLKSNFPALLGSLAAIGNPVGLIRGIGDGVSDFVTEPVKGFKRSLKELDPGYMVDGVARGTESLARHTVGGLADSASLLMETFSKYMAVVTLDRRYAQKRDRRRSLRNRSESRVTLAGGVESGFSKLIQGFKEGVTGVVRAPIRGAEKRGFEGFAKGLGKGLLGLLVKPIIGITDAATDVMIGVKSTVEYREEQQQSIALLKNQLRHRRPMYGRDKVLRPYNLEDAAAATLMLRTRCAGENYLSHLDMNDRVALLSVKRLIILGSKGEEQLALRFKHVDRLEARSIKQADGSDGWGIVVILNTPRRNGSEIEVISCHSEQEAIDLSTQIQRGVDLETSETVS